MKHNMGSSGKVMAHRAVVPAAAVLAALRSRVCQLTAFADTCMQSNPVLCTAGVCCQIPACLWGFNPSNLRDVALLQCQSCLSKPIQSKCWLEK